RKTKLDRERRPRKTPEGVVAFDAPRDQRVSHLLEPNVGNLGAEQSVLPAADVAGPTRRERHVVELQELGLRIVPRARKTLPERKQLPEPRARGQHAHSS